MRSLSILLCGYGWFAGIPEGETNNAELIARALVNNPRLVLADEPTGNLDARNADSIFQLLGELNRLQGTAFLVVTHDLQLAKRMSRQLEMRDGRLTAELSLMGAE